MALNQDAHRRNQQAFERIKQLRAKQKKYNITPENAYKSANQLSEYSNTAGKGLDKLGQITNNETLQNLGQKIANNTGSNLKNNMFNFAKNKITTLADKASAAKNAASTASNAASTAGNVSNAASTASNAANTASNAANVASTASNAANAASTASNAANAASNASNAASSASSAASSGASAAPVVGTALGAVSAGNNFAKGDNVNGALDVAKTGAAFIPVYGWIVSAAISAFQKARNMFIDKKMKAHQKTQDQAAKATEESMMSANETKQKIANKRAEMQQQMAAENPINGQLGDSNIEMPAMQDITNEFKEEAPQETVAQEPTQEDSKGSKIMDMIQGALNLANKEDADNTQDGQMTGGAANINTLDMFEDPTVFSDYNKLAREREQKEGVAPFKNIKYGIKNALRGDTTSDMNGSVAYDYRSPATEERENRRVADIINNEIAKRKQSQPQQPVEQTNAPIKIGQDVQLTPEQQARYNEAQAIQEAGNQKIINDIMAKANMQKTPILEGSMPTEPLPNLPNAAPTQMPTRGDFDPGQFEYINPDGSTAQVPSAQQAEQLEGAVQKNVTQPQTTPYDEKASKVADIMQRIRQGYGENATQAFDPANMTDKTFTGAVTDENGNVVNKEIDKNIWNRFGESIGTGQRLLSNPLMQGLIAGAIYKATGGDTGESIKYGVDWTQNKAKSDFYQKQMDPNAKPNIIGGYTASDWSTKESIERAKAQQKTAEANLKLKEEENRLRAEKLLLDIEKENKKSGKNDDGFAETFRILRDRKAPDRLEKLAQLLSDYSLINPEAAKKLAELHGIDLVIESK